VHIQGAVEANLVPARFRLWPRTVQPRRDRRTLNGVGRAAPGYVLDSIYV